MGIVSSLYKKFFIRRYDKEVGVPYYTYSDFEGLKQEAYSFINSKGVEIKYFYYFYEKPTQEKLILFCHGLGPGHAAYMREIDELAKRGFKVLTLDYTGCNESGGKNMGSLNYPTRDVMELLDYLKLEQPPVIVGHSLGGYTALNLMNLRKELQKAVILSGFLSISSILPTTIKNIFIASRILKYEQKVEPEYFDLGNVEYLKNTTDDLFFIQSEDDQMVHYDISLKVVEGIDNPHIKTLKMTGRKHNPNYTDCAVNYMNEVFGRYYTLLRQRAIKTDEQKIEYFKDVSIDRLTEQDKELFNQIIEFTNEW